MIDKRFKKKIHEIMAAWDKANSGKKTTCCFCGKVFDGIGNSTWPIYYEADGETNRCCDKCNEEIVCETRKDWTLIMKFRKQFNID